jgi:hypothetical protein
MKFVLVPILIVLMLSQTFSKWLVVIEYNLNKDFVAQKLCINKAKPKLNCHGKCQMMNRLVEEEIQNSTNTTNNTSKIKIPELVFSNETTQLIISSPVPTTISYNEEPPFFMDNAVISAIFHPPALG